jgi:hypothetical protein
MVNITLSVLPEVKARMDEHPEIKWSNSIRTLIEQKLDDFEEAEKLAKKLNLSEKDLKPILEKVNADMRKHSEALLNVCNNRR